MTSLTIGSNNSNAYVYRADGLRVSKTATGSSSSQSSTIYRYDGQMGVEDVEFNSSSAITAISRNALGARGIDAISRTTSSGTTVAYPLYDAHGNNVGMLSKSGSSWSLNDERTYDAWGQVRSGATTGDQKGRYCASLGHKQDDESGLVYMRARYYEPTSGRFASEDISMQGNNWYIYCNNSPVASVDFTGKSGGGETQEQKAAFWNKFEYGMVIVEICIALGTAYFDKMARGIIIGGFIMMAFWFGLTHLGSDEEASKMTMAQKMLLGCGEMVIGMSAGLGVAGTLIEIGEETSLAAHAWAVGTAYADMLGLFATLLAIDEGVGP